MRRLALALQAAVVAAFVVAAVSVWAHVGSAHGLTHTVGVFVVLAELLRDGVLYPAPTADLVYSVFYHPLAFAPVALLPGEGLDLVASLRLLVGIESLLCLALVVWLCARIGMRGVLAWQPAVWALCTVPVAFALLGMRDDPRAALLGLAAIAVHVRHGARWPIWSGVVLGLAFFVKATAPFAPGVALLFAAWREGRGVAGRLVATTAGVVGGGIAFVQFGLGTEFLDNGLRFVLGGAREARDLGATFAALGTDLTRDLVTPFVCGASLVMVGVSVVRRRVTTVDVLVLAVWCKTVVVYRSTGTDLNHLLDLVLFASLQLAGHLLPWLTQVRAALLLVAIGVLTVVGDALGRATFARLLLPGPSTSTRLAESRVAKVAAGLEYLSRSNPLPTLCEEPLVAWLSGQRPLVTDPFLTFAALRGRPEIRDLWFGDPSHPQAVRRVVLMFDPFAEDPAARDRAQAWYRDIHFDVALLDRLRGWQKVLSTDGATVFER